MMLWAIVSALSGCQELYCAVDQKNYSFRHDGVLGHLLAHVSGVYCPHANTLTVSGNVFKPTRSQQWLLACVKKCVPTSISDNEFTQSSTTEDGFPNDMLSPRMFRPLKASVFCTSPSMQTQQRGCTRSDSMNITIKGGFPRPSVVQDYDGSLAIQGWDDVNALVSSKVTDGSILASLAEDLRYRS